MSGFAESSSGRSNVSSIVSDSDEEGSNEDTITEDSESSGDDLSVDSVPSSRQSIAFITEPIGGREELRTRFATPKQKQEPSLIQSVKTGDILKVRQILRSGSDTNTTDFSNRTALHVACAFGRLEMVKLLISKGGNVDTGSLSGKTALHEACIGGHYHVLMLLISEVADLDVVDKKGMSAAHYCALNGEVECLTLLSNQVLF